MSSDEYFDELDSTFLEQVNAIEAAHVPPQRSPAVRRAAPPRPPQPRRASPAKASVYSAVIEVNDSDDFDSFTIDDEGLEIIDRLCDNALRDSVHVAGPSRPIFARTTSRPTIQTTLFGGRVQEKAPKASAQSKLSVQRRDSEVNNGFVGDPRKTKRWDHTAFAKTGWKKPQSTKGKERAIEFLDDEGEEEEEPEEFEQFPAPFVSIGYVQLPVNHRALTSFCIAVLYVSLYFSCQTD